MQVSNSNIQGKDSACTGKVIKVLYVDTLSSETARTNVVGIEQAYRRAAIVKPFDYRLLASRCGRSFMNWWLWFTAMWFRPDMIHLGKCESVRGATIRRIKRCLDTCVIHFYGDYRPDPQPWVVDIGRYADYTLLYHKDQALIQKHHEMGIENVGFWWVGTDPEVFYPRENRKCYDVVFMANNSDARDENTGRDSLGRRALVDAMLAEGINLDLFGSGWEYLARHPHANVHPFVGQEKFAEACSSARITLGFNSREIPFYTSWRRPFNSMACGAFHLTRYFPGLEEVFKNREDLVWFHSTEEAVSLVEYYLAHEEEREKIAASGMVEVKKHHTWDHRVADMLNLYKEISNRSRS